MEMNSKETLIMRILNQKLMGPKKIGVTGGANGQTECFECINCATPPRPGGYCRIKLCAKECKGECVDCATCEEQECIVPIPPGECE